MASCLPGFAGELADLKTAWNLWGRCCIWRISLLCVCSGKLRFIMKAFLCTSYFLSVSVTSFPLGWPTVFSEGTEFGPCCPEQFRTNIWLLLEVLLGKWNCCPIFLLELFWEPFFVSTLSQNFPFMTLRIWGSWNLSILASSPSSIRPFSNFWLSLRPSSVPFFQEWSLTGEYSLPSVIWMFLIHRGFGLPEYVSPITHVTDLNFHHLNIQIFRINFSPSKVTVVYLLGFFLFLSMSFGSLQFSKPLFLTKTWNSYNVEILNCSITSLSIVFLLVCKPGLSHRWQSSESLPQILEGIEFQ